MGAREGERRLVGGGGGLGSWGCSLCSELITRGAAPGHTEVQLSGAFGITRVPTTAEMVFIVTAATTCLPTTGRKESRARALPRLLPNYFLSIPMCLRASSLLCKPSPSRKEREREKSLPTSKHFSKGNSFHENFSDDCSQIELPASSFAILVFLF